MLNWQLGSVRIEVGPKPTADASALFSPGSGTPMKQDKFVKEMREKQWSLDVKMVQTRKDRAIIHKGYLEALKHRDRVCDALKRPGKIKSRKFRKELEARKVALDNEIDTLEWMLLKTHTDYLALANEHREVSSVIE